MRRTLISSALVLSLLATGAAATGSVTATDRAGSRAVSDGRATGSPGSEQAALATARSSGHRVEVTDNRDESATEYANPDGTLTLEQTVQPTRVRRGSGWVPVDLSLHRGADGSISTGATAFGLRLSAGGSQKLVIVNDGAKEFSLAWPATLPAPVLRDDTATYPEVLPGVDLVVRATDSGFAEVLVVKTREAAANPALATVHFGLSLSGATLHEQAGGGFIASDPSGATVFTSPQPMMWDSSDSPDGAGARLRGPTPASHMALIPTTIAPDSVVLTPSQALFNDRTTTYPVYVDPSVSVGKLAWAEVWKENPNSTDINPSHEAMVGFENDPCCPPNSTVRAFWRMDSAKVNGKHVLSATFRTHEWWAWSCQARVVELWWTGSITSTLTWNNQSWIAKQTTANTAKRRGDASCPEGDVEFNVTSLAQTAARQNWADMTLGLKSSNETDPYTWKKFDNNPVLVITYNSVPAAPTNLTIDGKSCGTGTYLGTTTPTMRTTVTDPDAGSLLDVSMYWAPTGGAINETDKVVQSAVAAGSQAVAPVPPGRLSDGQYFWQAKDTDGIDTSPLSATCTFNVDTSPPAATAVSSVSYPADGNFHGGVGRTGSFTFSPNGSGDVIAYRYGWADPPTTEIAVSPGASYTATATPATTGLNTLYVRSVDRAGNLSPVTTYTFLAGAPTSPAGSWLSPGVPETGTGTLTDTSGNGRTATLSSGAHLDPGRDGTANSAVTLNGTTGDATTSGPVVTTNASFTVAAWVKLSATSNWATVVCQQGLTNCGMLLQYDQTDNRWALTYQTTDDASATTVLAKSSTAPRVGVWTHLVGTYDAGPGVLSIYVNGVLSGTANARIGWNAGGPLLIGAEKHTSLRYWFPGTIADVRVWDRLVYPDEIRTIASANTLVGWWPLDFDGSDSSGYDHPLTATGNVGQGSGYDGLGDATFDGSTAALSSSGPVVLTDQSFTVAAWVLLSDTGSGHTAICQEGSRVCSFFLQYDKAGNTWAFQLCPSDVDNVACVRALSVSAADLGVWTHLVGVYDAGTSQARLYVNGQQVGSVAVPGGVFNAIGPLDVGRGKVNGVPGGWWPGELDSVHLYLGVLSDADIVNLFNQ